MSGNKYLILNEYQGDTNDEYTIVMSHLFSVFTIFDWV